MTATTLRCPRGHVWNPAEFDDDPTPIPGPVACPFCGALCSSTLTPADSLQSVKVTTRDDADSPPVIPGYQVLDVLGRGGMGVVYRARQVRTDRVVALKVPGHLDLETRARFTIEAQAAARVSHPNIVQVYEVGEHAGRPFLALEYVPGGTLADRLTGTPFPPRPAAALAATVARAVGAAHTQGVVHRDLKPANILLQSDERGVMSGESQHSTLITHHSSFHPKVADFGLARRLDVDAGQTRSGMILGTPDYMAPEQAAGDSHRVGRPADVWALGALLYELLTGRPPFRGVGMMDTLDQVRTHDPVAPRRLVPGVPRDLETICLKCLHKDPARRYPEAGELADDLGRFLDGLPVRARPVSRVERWVKRARRNPAAAGLAAGLWVVLIAAAAYGVWYHLRLQAQRDRARYHFEMSVRSVEGLLTEVAEEDLALEPRAELKRQALLEKALAFYEELLRVEPDDPSLAWLAAHGARQVGDIQRLLGRYAEALAAYDRALDRLAPLAARPPSGTDPAREIADCHNFTGEVHRLRGDPAAAATAYRRALALQQQLFTDHSDHPGYRQDISRTRYNLGIVARQTGRPDDAVAELTEAARLLDEVPADDLVQHRHRARIFLNLGPALRATGQLGAAEEAASRAIALFDALVATAGGRPDFQHELAVALINRGLVRQSARDPAGADADLKRAEGLLGNLVRDFHSTPQYKAEQARAYNARAVVAFDAGRPGDGTAMFGQAVEVWAGLVARHNTPDYHGELGIALGNQGRAVYQSDPIAAQRLLTRGLTELLVGLKANSDHPAFAHSFRQQSRDLAGLLVGAGDHTKARAFARQVADALPDRAIAVRRAVILLSMCMTSHQAEPVALLAGGVAAIEVDGYERLAVELVTGAGPLDWSALRADPDCAPLLARPAFAKTLGR